MREGVAESMVVDGKVQLRNAVLGINYFGMTYILDELFT